MIITTLAICAHLLTAEAAAVETSSVSALSVAPVVATTVDWEVPSYFISGMPFEAKVEIKVGDEGATVPSWAFGVAAFSADGNALGKRDQASPVSLSAGTTLNLSFDLAGSLPTDAASFQLSFDVDGAGAAREVRMVKLAEEGLDFIKMPAADLAKYWVLMKTNQGDMLMEFWPDKTPLHVGNFLDLCYTDFYDGVIFHRVIPGFMIQGGDPTGTGTGNGPRMLQAEFHDAKHVPGVLSMARTQDPNSASCQFFVMHGNATHLDNQYSAFGKLISGLEVADKIVNTPRDARDRPRERQFIEDAIVLVAPTSGN